MKDQPDLVVPAACPDQVLNKKCSLWWNFLESMLSSNVDNRDIIPIKINIIRSKYFPNDKA